MSMKLAWALFILVLGCSIVGMARADEGVIDSKGVKIHYVTEGEGEAVVLIHGWLSDSTMWGRDGAGNTKLSPAPGYKVIALDCRGHGKSDKPHEVGKYGAEMAEDVVRLLDHLKVKKAHLIGYSMGAFIAGKVAATHPERVISIVYGGQAPLLTGESGSQEIDVFAKAAEDGKGMGPYIMYVSPAERKPTQEQADAIAKVMYGGKDVLAFAAAGRSFKGLEVPMKSLQKCKVPCLFIYGSKEPERLKQRVESLRKALGQVEVKEIEGADHMTTLVKPEFGTALMTFLTTHKGK